MSTTTDSPSSQNRPPKIPTCPDCGYDPTAPPDRLDRDRPYVEARFGLDGEGRALLCPVCGAMIRRTVPDRA